MTEAIVPAGYHSINPILRVEDAAKALGFYAKAFGAVEDFRREADGRLLLVVVRIGDSPVMLFDGDNEPPVPTGGDRTGNGLVLKLYVADVDRVFAAALAEGAVVEQPVENQYFGERSGMLTDPFGFSWQIATYVEEVPHEEIERRMHQAIRK